MTRHTTARSRLAAACTALALCATFGATATTAAADTRSSVQVATAADAVTSGTIPAGALSVVNFAPTWGDKQANKASMLEYMAKAHDADVKMIVFPEMALTGYVSSSDPESPAYQMAVSQAETIASPITQEIAAAAKSYGMWTIFGTSERIPGDTAHAYNSAFAISPDGTVTSYQKIAPVEGSWATPGTTPVILQTEWGLAALSICYDTYANPEIERYYAAQGVSLLINPTATSRSYADIDGDGTKDGLGWEWYYRNRLESIASRDGLVIASADLVGPDGYAEPGKAQPYDFPGGSVIVSGSANYSAGLNADGSINVGTAGALTNDTALRLRVPSTTQVSADFHPDYYAQWYGELADRQEAGEKLSYRYGGDTSPTVAVANVSAVWADKAANTAMMTQYARYAAEQGVDLLVFPETILTGYDSTDPKGAADAHSSNADANKLLAASDDYMQVVLAEKVVGADGDTSRGESVQAMAALAKELHMTIVFGLSEMPEGGPIVDGGVNKVYNSAAICFPDGHTESYQKMHRAGAEETVWSVPGTTPKMFEMADFTGSDGKPLKVGVNICRDGHFYPELGRYYAASGAELLVHPTATTGNAWYRESRIGSYTDRDGMAAATANIWGPDGYPLDETGAPIYSVDEAGETVSSGKPVAGYNYAGVKSNPFRSTSLVINAWSGKDGTRFDYATGSALDTSGTGGGADPAVTADWTFEQGAYDPDNLEYRTMNLKSAGFSITNFQPRLFSKMYDKLAQQTIPGYVAKYADSAALDTSSLVAPLADAVALLDDREELAQPIEDAQALLANTTFSSEQQPLVDAAREALVTAVDAAKPAPADDPSNDEDPAGTVVADDPTIDEPTVDEPSLVVDEPAAAAADTPASGPMAMTGSATVTAIAVMLALTAGGVTLLVVRRRSTVE